MTTNRKPLTNASDLPPDVIAADLDYRQGEINDSYWEFRKRLQAAGFEADGLTFYRVKGLGWVLTTLHISNPGRRNSAAAQTARSYGIGVADSKVYTVGRGPHVEAEVHVTITRTNVERLWRYVELWLKGMGDASAIRDRISSRRAQGQLHRQAGRTSWTW